MKSLNRILAVVGPQMEPSPATRRGAELARKSGARLDLLMPVYDRHIAAAENLAEPEVARRALEHFVDERSRWLTGYAEELARRGINVSAEVSWAFNAFEVVVGRVLDDSHDLVVADLRRDDFPSGGSAVQVTDWRLSRLCPAPLMLVQCGSAATFNRIAAAVDPTHPDAHPSGLDGQVVETALALAKLLEQNLELLHVFPYLDPDASSRRELNALAARLRQEHEAAFSTFAEQFPISKDNCKLLLGDPAKSLMSYVAGANVDLLVVGSQYRSGFDRLLLGSNSEALIAHAPCDVLVVRPKGFSDALKRDRDYRQLLKKRKQDGS